MDRRWGHLPYELDQGRDRPDICLGTDEFHTPERLTDELVLRFSTEGLSVAINRPFSGALVPMHYFRNGDRVTSIIVEVNRRLYLDEVSGKMGAHFSRIQSLRAKVLENVGA
jgi:N-formylglutamate deformylase